MLLKPEFLIFIYDGPETNSFIVVKKKDFLQCLLIVLKMSIGRAVVRLIFNRIQ